MERRDNPGTPEPRETQALFGEATAESGASGRFDSPAPGESVEAQNRLRIGVGRSQGIANPKNTSSIKRGAETAVGR
jgi:hypothetical protein